MEWNSLKPLNKIKLKKDMKMLLLHILNEEGAYFELHQIMQKVSELKISPSLSSVKLI